jgi:nicotinamidase-related amidase
MENQGKRALVIVDIQNDYFPGGGFPLVGPEAAAEAAASVLARFRDSGEPVFHVRHVWDEPDATFMVPGTPGIEINEAVAPRGEEPVIEKEAPNSFLRTDLEARLRALDVDHLVVAGMMTSVCVDATVRAGVDLGFEATVVADACAAPDLAFGGVEVPAASVHAAFLAALADSYGSVVDSGELLG